MEHSEALHLMSLFDHGYSIKVNDGPYLDGFVKAMSIDESNGDVCYSSDVYSDRPLKEIGTYQVQVFKPEVKLWTHYDHGTASLDNMKFLNDMVDSKDIDDLGLDVSCMDYEVK